VECRHEDADGIRIIHLAGRMDIEGNQEIALRFDTLTASGGPAVIVVLSGLDFIGSIGIATLVGAARAGKKSGRLPPLCGARAQVLKALNGANIPTIIPTCDTLEDARVRVTTRAEP